MNIIAFFRSIQVILILISISAASTMGQGSGTENGYNWTAVSGGVSITGYSGAGGAVIIPSILNGMPVVNIGAHAFYGYYSISNVTIPASVSGIGAGAFADCDYLENIGVDAANPNFANVDGCLLNKEQTLFIQCPGAKSGSFVIPDGVTEIGKEAFSRCYRLTGVAIPDSVTKIGSSAFNSCYGLNDITIPNGLAAIEDYSFYYCGLRSITIPITVSRIGRSAFQYCGNLQSISLPAGLNMIGFKAFYGSGIGIVTIPSSVNSLESQAFSNCSNLKTAVINGSLTSVGNNIFEYCYALSTVNLNGPTQIGPFMFYQCTRLAGVHIGNSVRSIGRAAFYTCDNLRTLTIPSSVTDIEDNAFDVCCNLSFVCFQGNKPHTSDGGYNVFASGPSPPSVVYYRNGASGWEIPFGTRNVAPCAECADTNGVLQVGISPFLAYLEGARWALDQETSFGRGNGETVTIPAGTHTIKFQSIPGWITPCNQTVVLVGGETVTLGGYYSPIPKISATITPLRVTANQADTSPPPTVNTSVIPLPDRGRLSAPQNRFALGKGVAADGVTPVLFSITGTATNYSFEISINGGTFTNNNLSSRLFVLDENGWTNSPSFTISPDASGTNGTAFAYLQGLRWSDFASVNSTSNEVAAILTLFSGGTPITNISFGIRPVPIVLVHGIADK